MKERDKWPAVWSEIPIAGFKKCKVQLEQEPFLTAIYFAIELLIENITIPGILSTKDIAIKQRQDEVL